MATINLGNLTFTHKGDYASGTAYVKNDIVYYATNGNSYIAKGATTGNAPTSTAHWDIFVTGAGGIWNAGLSLGSAEQIVQVNSAGNALEFTAKPSGGVVQTVLGTYNTATSQGGTTYNVYITDGTITPTSASNHIIGISTSHGSVTNANSGGTSRDSFFEIQRAITGGASTQIQEVSQRCERNIGGDDMPCMATMVFRDSPNTTSSVNYKMYTKGEGGGWDTFWNQNGDGSAHSGVGTMLLMEVKV